jgi:hypothetical protein
VDYQYTYLTGALLLGIVWLFFFIKRKDLRREMLFMTAFVGLLALTEIYYFGRYWEPNHIFKLYKLNVGIEDFLLCSFYGGVGAVTYEFIFNKIDSMRTVDNSRNRFIKILISLMVGLVVLFMLEILTDYNLVITSGFAQLLVGFTLLLFRSDLLIPSLINAIIFMLIIIAIEYIGNVIYPGAINTIWQQEFLTSSFQIFGVPIEEYFWNFSLGMAIGPAYEVFMGTMDSKYSKKI